jgi:hypothetical protein
MRKKRITTRKRRRRRGGVEWTKYNERKINK